MFRERLMPLTSGEFHMKALVSHPREPLSRDKLESQPCPWS
ncbi:hypothetical protein ACLB1E_08765 [Escherichia coli]